MGDYTLCHLHFTLKKETPPKVIDIVSRIIVSGYRSNVDPVELSCFIPTDSAYHHVKGFIDSKEHRSEWSDEYEGLRINTIFQVKYSHGIYEFIKYISPWVEVNESNKGCVGWTLSEYASYPTYHFVKEDKEDPKDQYIKDLESQLAQFMTSRTKS